MPTLSESVQLHTLCKPVHKSVERLRRILKEQEIDVIINQWCLPYYVTSACRQAMKGLSCRLVAVHHNAPNLNARIVRATMAVARADNIWRRFFAKTKLGLYKLATQMSMKYVYRHSDAYVLLSECFRESFQHITGIKNADKLCVIPNPLTLDGAPPKFEEKSCEILYVGRLERIQKRVDRVLLVWNILQKKFPQWSIRIVGDGPDRAALEAMSAELGLERIRFEGFRSPKEFYHRASVLLLTSEFEGFGLVICEGMHFGVIPVVYGSYTAAYDIIDDNVNGYVVEATHGFPAEEMANYVAMVMKDKEKRDEMYHQSISRSGLFNLENIACKWNSLFRRIVS